MRSLASVFWDDGDSLDAAFDKADAIHARLEQFGLVEDTDAFVGDP